MSTPLHSNRQWKAPEGYPCPPYQGHGSNRPQTGLQRRSNQTFIMDEDIRVLTQQKITAFLALCGVSDSSHSSIESHILGIADYGKACAHWGPRAANVPCSEQFMKVDSRLDCKACQHVLQRKTIHSPPTSFADLVAYLQSQKQAVK